MKCICICIGIYLNAYWHRIIYLVSCSFCCIIIDFISHYFITEAEEEFAVSLDKIKYILIQDNIFCNVFIWLYQYWLFFISHYLLFIILLFPILLIRIHTCIVTLLIKIIWCNQMKDSKTLYPTMLKCINSITDAILARPTTQYCRSHYAK